MDENSSKSSEEGKKGRSSEGDHSESDSDFANSTLIDNDPVKVLQLSQPFFVADTLEDDESMIISSQEDTVPFLIPSTPIDTGKGQESCVRGQKDESITVLDETCDMGESENKAQMVLKSDNHPTSLNESDMTQDLPDLDATQELFPCKESPKKASLERSNKSLDDDDDWNLKFSETQETQDLAAVAEPPKSAKLPIEEKSSVFKQKVPDLEEEKDIKLQSIGILTEKKEVSKPESNLHIQIAELDDLETQSDDEIEPSQPCLSEYQGLSSLRFQSTQAAKNIISREQNKENITKNSDIKSSADDSNVDIPSTLPLFLQNEPDGIPPTPFKTSDKFDDADMKSDSVIDITECGRSTESPNIIKEVEIVESNLNVSEKEDIITIDSVESLHGKAEGSNVHVKLPEEVSAPVAEELKFDVVKLRAVESPPEKNVRSKVIDAKEDEKLETTKLSKEKELVKNKNETPPTSMLPPLLTSRISSLRKQSYKSTEKLSTLSHLDTPESTNEVLLGTVPTKATVQRICNSSGFNLDDESIQKILSLQPKEKYTFTKSIRFEDGKAYLNEYIVIEFPGEPPRFEIPISPHSGSSNTSSTVSSKTLHSGEIADVSSSSSGGKYGGIFNLHATNSSQLLSSQETCPEHYPKTSTQNSDQPKSFAAVGFEPLKTKKSIPAKKNSSPPSKKLSPIKSDDKEESKKGIRGRRNARKKAATTKSKTTLKSNRSRSRRTTSIEDSDSSKKVESSKETNPKKNTRSRKVTPSKDPVVESSSARDIPIAEDSGGAYEESHFGNITPGVRVMARWKDGFYYPGTVQSQELEGRWVVMFDDGDTRTIAQENLMKLAMLQSGTSVLVQSSDQFYDPGIVCGHFREGNKVGYEIELDSGTTKRYPRSCVILSTDQAKLITSSRPPTTPATMTINLDNIIDGKRKRKSVQSPVSSPVVKKSPRISEKTSKLDSNLDSTAGSGESSMQKTRHFENSTETEDDVRPRKRHKKNIAHSSSETTKVLPKRSAKNSKLFKDCAFLLTNAERKIVHRNDDSDNNSTEGEENPLFDKDELCSDISTHGGLILDKFEDIQKCTRKNIFLLATTYLRTIKYIQCLAAGILCIKHNFVKECCLVNELRKHTNYLLPAGYSVVSKEVIDWHGRSDALKGLKIVLISSPESPFVHIWTPVLLAAKADFVQKWNLPSSKTGSCAVLDVLITNHLCPPDVLQSAKRRKIPIVSSEWIIQSLIAGKSLPYNAHPKFKHDFTE